MGAAFVVSELGESGESPLSPHSHQAWLTDPIPPQHGVPHPICTNYPQNTVTKDLTKKGLIGFMVPEGDCSRKPKAHIWNHSMKHRVHMEWPKAWALERLASVTHFLQQGRLGTKHLSLWEAVSFKPSKKEPDRSVLP